MARLRTLKPEFFTHEILGELSPLHRLFYAGLWCHADREGRLEDRPKYLKAVILPYDDGDADLMLNDLASHGFVVRYVVDGRRLLAIPAFSKHQQPHKKERPSTLPAPTPTEPRAPPLVVVSDEHGESTVPVHDEHPADNVASRAVFGLGEKPCLGEVGGGEGASAPARAPPVLAPGQPMALQALWNSEAHEDLPRWEELTDDRRKHARARLKERAMDGPKGWREVVRRISASAFCRGTNDRGWKADADFLLRPGTAAKVLEGKYDDRPAAPPKGAPRAQDMKWAKEGGVDAMF